MLGRIDLRGAMLEQVPDGFIIHEAAFAANSKVRLRCPALSLGCSS